jgi:Flp pilus assembly protein TadG
MRAVTRSRWRRRRGDDGAAAVEFALLFPIFMVLAMGTIAAGTAFSKQINITQAAREGSRFGATLDIPSTGGIGPWLSAVDTGLIGAAGAQDNPLAGYTHRCVAYVRTTTTVAGVTTIDTVNSKHSEDGGVATAGPCPKTTAPLIANTDYVQVTLTRDTSFNAIFLNPTIQLDATSVTPYEGDAP